MHPILFRIPIPNWNVPGIGPLHDTFTQGSIPIYSYGVMLGLSLVVGWYLTLWLAERDGLPKETMANCYVVTALAAIVGSRLLYVATNVDEFMVCVNQAGEIVAGTVNNCPADSTESFSWKSIFAFRRGGLVAYGGFLGGYLGSWAYLKRKKIPLMPWADVAVPSLASGLAITRIGCYLFGCDFGKPLSDSAPGFLQKIGTFPHWAENTVDRGDGSPAWIQHVNAGLIDRTAEHSMPVHPTQLYESLVGLALLGLLMYQRKHQRFRGQVFMLFAFAYGFARFLLEIVRDDAERGAYGPELGAHLLVPGSLALFAAAYSIGFAVAVPNVSMRRLTQVLSFVPAVVAYLAMRPASFVTASLVQLSTSQWVGLLTAVAVSIAFMLFWKAAEAHPSDAMALHLEGFRAEQAKLEAKKSGEKAPEPEEEEEAEESEAPKKAKKKAKKGKKKQEVVEASFDDDAKSESKESEVDDDEAEGDDESKTEKVDDADAKESKVDDEKGSNASEEKPSKKRDDDSDDEKPTKDDESDEAKVDDSDDEKPAKDDESDEAKDDDSDDEKPAKDDESDEQKPKDDVSDEESEEKSAK